MDYTLPAPISTAEEVVHNCANVAITIRKTIGKIIEKNISDIDLNTSLDDLELGIMARALLVEDLEYAFGIKISEGNNLANIQGVIDYVTAAIKKNNLSKND